MELHKDAAAQDLLDVLDERIWSGDDRDELARLMTNANVVKAPAGRALAPKDGVTGDDQIESVYLLLSGVVGQIQEFADGRRAIAALFHPGDLLDRRAPSDPGAFFALTPVEACAMSAGMFDAAAALSDRLSEAVRREHRSLAARARAHSVDLAKKTPIERVASLLVELLAMSGVATADEPGPETLSLPFSRADIGDYLGVQPETVSRAIRKLERDGVITLPTAHRVAVVDLDALKRIAAAEAA